MLRYGGRMRGEPYYVNLGNLYNEGGVVSLDHVTSTVGMMGARMNGGELVVSHSLLSNNIGNGLNVNGGTMTVVESIIQQNGQAGLYANEGRH